MKNNITFSESENSKIVSGWNHSHFSKGLDLYTFQPVKNYFYRCVSGDEEGIAKENWFEDWLIKTYLKDKIPVANCLTLCCGHGERDRRLAKMEVFENCLGLDISPGAIEACKINASNEKFNNLKYATADLNKDSLKRNAYDLIYVGGGMHHILNLEHLVDEIYLSLKPGGLLVCDEYIGPSYNDLSNRHREVINSAIHLIPKRLRYYTNIPTHVGMAGSSAIIIACLRALMKFYSFDISKPKLANLALSVETEELGIGAGLQDRVAQVYEGLTYMNFDRELMESRGFGDYQSLDSGLLQNIYLAYKSELSEGSEVFHNDLRGRFNSGEPEVIEAMTRWADIAEEVRACLRSSETRPIGHLLNANFDLRKSVCNIHPDNVAMIDAARSVGASSKFTGSGGAIIGQYSDEPMFEALVNTLQSLGITVLKPDII
ncbi:methyltransferase domain-containing protein [Akkermansiaceae bacterium]|nr:methyltransferase domain-containing protein [Akkermansiaceae bacterium]